MNQVFKIRVACAAAAAASLQLWNEKGKSPGDETPEHFDLFLVCLGFFARKQVIFFSRKVLLEKRCFVHELIIRFPSFSVSHWVPTHLKSNEGHVCATGLRD